MAPPTEEQQVDQFVNELFEKRDTPLSESNSPATPVSEQEQQEAKASIMQIVGDAVAQMQEAQQGQILSLKIESKYSE